jgi:hypothetical protein
MFATMAGSTDIQETAAILLATDALSHSGGYRQYRG